jgi:hypothetical protein
MDVKAFIFEATDKALRIDEAVKGVDLAKEAVEAAKAAVEAARAGVDTAKLAVVAAKEDLDTYADRAEEFGLTKAKFKDAVERMKVLLADIGAVDTTDTAEPVEQKPKAPRKRKVQDTADVGQQTQNTTEVSAQTASTEEAAETDVSASSPSTMETPAFDDVTMIGEIKDAASHRLAGEAAKSGYIGFSQADDVDGGEVTQSGDITSAAETPNTTEETTAPDITTEDELDNSFAEQELVDFVDELGSSDATVSKVLTSAIRVLSWHATNVACQELRTFSSPLSLTGILAVEGIAYLPADIRADYEIAVSEGTEKLAAAISWYNKGIELLADAKAVSDFRFSEAVKTTRAPAAGKKPVEVVVQSEAAADADEPDASLDAEIGEHLSHDVESATIEDVDIFAAASAVEEPSSVEVSASTEVPPVAEEKSEPPFLAKPSKPSWLNKD